MIQASLTDCIQSLAVIRQSFAVCLLVYACDRTSIREVGLIEEDELKDMVSRRRQNARAVTTDDYDPIRVDPTILQAISQYLRLDIPVVTSYIAKFFHLFFNTSPLIPSYEVDNFVLKNGSLVSEW